MQVHTIARVLLGASLLIEGGSALHRFRRRRLAFEAAARRAAATGRPLIVVGDPDAGAHTRLMRAYECGDLCIDLQGCPRCQVMKAADLTLGPIEGIADDSAVVFVSCVLEYVTDLKAALRELVRIAGSRENLFLVLDEPWTLTATLYPGSAVDRHLQRAHPRHAAGDDDPQDRHGRRPHDVGYLCMPTPLMENRISVLVQINGVIERNRKNIELALILKGTRGRVGFASAKRATPLETSHARDNHDHDQTQTDAQPQARRQGLPPGRRALVDPLQAKRERSPVGARCLQGSCKCGRCRS